MKKLIIFIFSIVLLGSCSKERRVKFSIEMGDDYTYLYPNSSTVNTQGWCWAGVNFEYISAGLNQEGGTNGVGQAQSSVGPDYNSLFSETQEYIFVKNDNITIELDGIVHLMENVSFVVKAHIKNDEIILWNNTYNYAGGAIDETQNWIVS